jgi:hypothetical protein
VFYAVTKPLHRISNVNARKWWWLVPEVVAAASLATVLAWPAPADLQQQLARKAQGVLEEFPPVGQGGRVLCVAEPFGYQPRGAQRIEDVSVIYAYYLCAAGEKGTEWDYASRISGPVVVTVRPPRIQIAEAGAGYPDRVRAMIPPEWQARALAGFSDPATPAELRKRYDAEIAGA